MAMLRVSLIRALCALAVSTLLIGCGSKHGPANAGSPSPEPTPTPTVAVTPTAATPTPTGLTPTPTATPVSLCGNGVINGNEICDGTAFDPSLCAASACTCEDFCDTGGGTLSCKADCTPNFSRCTGGNCQL